MVQKQAKNDIIRRNQWNHIIKHYQSIMMQSWLRHTDIVIECGI